MTDKQRCIQAQHTAFGVACSLLQHDPAWLAERDEYRARLHAQEDKRAWIAYSARCGLPPRIALRLLNQTMEDDDAQLRTV